MSEPQYPDLPLHSGSGTDDGAQNASGNVIDESLVGWTSTQAGGVGATTEPKPGAPHVSS